MLRANPMVIRRCQTILGQFCRSVANQLSRQHPDIVEGRDILLTKLGPKGAMQYSTCWGGLGNEEARGVDVDADGNAYVVGITGSSSFPQKNNAGVQTNTGNSSWESGFVLKVSPTPSPKFSTYLGGNDMTFLQSVVVDNDKVYVSGSTGAWDHATKWPDASAGAYQPGYTGGFDPFVARLRFEPGAPHAPVMDRITYLPGSDREYPWYMAVGSSGVWMVVDGESTDFPQVNPLQACSPGNNHVVRLDADLTTLLFSSCLGGSNGNSEEARGLVLDAAGSAYVAGFTQSPDFPTTEGAHDRTCGNDSLCGRSDAWVVKVSP